MLLIFITLLTIFKIVSQSYLQVDAPIFVIGKNQLSDERYDNLETENSELGHVVLVKYYWFDLKLPGFVPKYFLNW